MRVVDDPLVPAVVDGFPDGAQLLHRADVDKIAHRTGKGPLRCAQALELPDPAGRDRACGVHAGPALASNPHFGPGVGIAVAHGPVVVHAVAVAALVAGDDARRHAHAAHEHGKGRCNVLAKALLAVKPEVVGGVNAVHHAGLQCVGVAARFQLLQGCCDQSSGIHIGAQLGAQLFAQRFGARVAAGRQLQIAFEFRRGLQRAVAEVGIALRIHAQHIGNGAPAHPLQAGRHAQAAHGSAGRKLRRGLDGIQQRQPAALAGLNQHLVANGLAAHAQLRRVHGVQHRVGLPVAAIELAEHRAAKIQGAGGGLFLAGCIKANAQCHAVVHGQRRHFAYAHVL